MASASVSSQGGADTRETPVPMDGIESPPGLGKKRQPEFQDVDDQEPTPTELADPQQNRRGGADTKRELTLQDLMDAMQTGFGNQNQKMDFMSRDVAKTQRETEAKELSAKAVTVANDTKDSFEALEKRVALLEKSPPTAPSTAKTQPIPTHKGDMRRDFEIPRLDLPPTRPTFNKP